MLEEVCLTERLGQGGMGCVYAGRDVHSSTELAVKRLRKNATETSRVLLRREARLMMMVRSPYVVRAIGLVEDESGASLVMDRLAGRNLERHVEECGRLTLAQMAVVVTQVASALTAIHEAGVVHADVKLENVMVEERGRGLHATLIDFGVSRHLDEQPLDIDMTPSGTLSAMSREQIMEPETPTTSWDVWGLACLAFTCITGVSPHEGGSLAAVLISTMNGSRPRIAELRPDLPRALDDVFDRAFAEDPVERHRTPLAFANALKETIGGVLGWAERVGKSAEESAVFLLSRRIAGRRHAPSLAAQASVGGAGARSSFRYGARRAGLTVQNSPARTSQCGDHARARRSLSCPHGASPSPR